MNETPAALTVMIADDDELIRKVIVIYFSARGYRVVAVASGPECLAQLRVNEPDALLLDVTMPGMDGWEVCRRTREFSAVPIIMLTARAQESDRKMGVAAGARRVCDEAGFAEGVGGHSSHARRGARFVTRCRWPRDRGLIRSEPGVGRSSESTRGAGATGSARLESPGALLQRQPGPRQ